MHLMPIVLKTIKDAKREIAVFIINSTLLVLVYNLYMDSLFLFYPIVLSASVLIVYLFINGISVSLFLKRLEKAKIPGDNDDCDNELESRVFNTISEIHNKHLGEISRLNTQINTRNALFSQFIHSMKSSVAIIELACEKFGGIEVAAAPLSDIEIENGKLKRNLEQSLNLLRLDAFANDYIPEGVDLAMLVTRIINDHKRDFIYAGVFPKLKGEGFVHTDSKWCGFMISQLISNAIKYSDSGTHVMFEIAVLEKYTELRITDCGIGIPPEDLPRVFDMFFTGTNGRQRKESTGLGLFMVKHIADRLSIGIHMDSKLEKGTTVTLSFHTLTKM